MKTVSGILSMAFAVALISCDDANNSNDIRSDKDRTDNEIVVKKDEDLTAKEKRDMNWDELDWNSPVVRYDEVKNKNVTIRGNDRYDIYGLDETVLFNSGESRLKENAKDNLDEVAATLNNKYKGDIRVYGHTDNEDTKSSNKKLSRDRAEAVKDYLVNKGVDKDRISCHARGEKDPVASNDTNSGRKANRRVEIVVAK
jgi:outer membrane protein OmpA-like peptidoglycan-associated protein